MSELIQSSPVTPLSAEFPQPPSIEPLLKAAEHCRELLQNNPEDIELRIALTNVYGRLGSRYYSLGQSAEEATTFVCALQLWESPSPRVAAHPDFRYWLATTRSWRGGLALHQEESALGYRWLLSADEIWEQLEEEQPDNLDVLAKATSCRYDLQRITNIGSLAEVCRPSLEVLKARLEQQFQGSSSNPAPPPNRVLRKRLALICLVPGNARSQTDSAKLARESWQQAADLYATLGTNGSQPDTAEDALLLILAGDACGRLAGVSASDPYYARAVPAFERAGKLLDTLREHIPDGAWLSEMLSHVYCTLARCHAKAGRPDLAEKTYQDQVRPLIAYLEAKRTDPPHAMTAEYSMCQLVHGLSDAGLRPAALAVARCAAKFTTEYVAFPVRYPELDFAMAVCAWELRAACGTSGTLPPRFNRPITPAASGPTTGRPVPMPTRAASNSPTPGWRSARPSLHWAATTKRGPRSRKPYPSNAAFWIDRPRWSISASGLTAATICSWIAASAAVTGPAPPPRCTIAKNSGRTIPTG